MISATAVMVGCTSNDVVAIPDAPLEECVYQGATTEFAVWSPAASAARVRIYESALDSVEVMKCRMKKSDGGLWKVVVEEDLKGKFYAFQVKVKGDWLEETAGISAKAVGVNGLRGAVIDWAETDPKGWDKDRSPEIKRSETIIYELHYRDFSIHWSSGIRNKGKFIALTEKGTRSTRGDVTGIDHLKELGVTYVQLMPSTDFASIDETHLEERKYHWGYEPLNYNAVEGSYSTDPFNPVTRIKEFKQMIQALHGAGMRVILDVVYNHTTTAGNTGFERTMPGYFYRMREDGKYANGSGCGNETASEKEMFRKYMIESLEWWMKEYHIDGFRFDLMGIHDIETMNIISERLHAINPEVLLYGEGWAASTPAYPVEKLAMKDNAYKLDRIGVFSDDFRNALHGPLRIGMKCEDAGFMDGMPGNKRNIMFGIVGGIKHPQIGGTSWASNPLQHISYVTCHDGRCLRDRLQLIDAAHDDDRWEMIKLAQTAVYTSQGIPFIFNGEEIFRHKYTEENSFNSSDTVNGIDWRLKSTYQHLTDYYSALSDIRRAHPGFCLGDAELVREKLEFIETSDPAVVAFRINGLDGIDPARSLTVLLNGSKKPVKVEIPRGKYVVLAQGGKADADGLGAYSGSYISAAATSATILAEN